MNCEDCQDDVQKNCQAFIVATIMHYFIFFLSFVVHPYFPDRMGCPRGLQFLMFHYVIFLGVNFEEEDNRPSVLYEAISTTR